MIGIVLIPFEYFDVQGTSLKIKQLKNKANKLKKAAPGEDVSPIGLVGQDQQRENQEFDLEADAEAQEEMELESADEGDILDVDQTFCQRLKSLVQNKSFVLLCVSLTGLYFIITGIQYWVSDYLITEIGQSESVVFISFAIISVTGPVLGVVVGGNVTTALGGYNSEKSLILSSCVSVFCLCCAAPIPFFDNFYVVAILLWLLLFFGGFILPCMTGIMLNTVDQSLKTTANSIANLSYNMLGFLPAPFVYGAIYDFGEGKNAR